MLALIVVGGLFFVACALLVKFSAMNASIIFAAFAFMTVIAPLLSAGILSLAESRGTFPPSAAPAWLLPTKSLLCSLVVSLLVVELTTAFMRYQATSIRVFAILFLTVAGSVILLFLHRGRAAFARRMSDGLDVLLVLSLAGAVFVFSPFEPASPIPIGYLAYALDAPSFWCWAIVGVLWTVFGIWLRQIEVPLRLRTNGTATYVALALVVLFIVSLYDDGHYIHIMSYEPLVDAAMHVLRGGVPMVDAYSQYGLLPWLIFDLAYLKLPATFGTAAVVQRIDNLAFFLVIFAMVIVVSKRRLSALWFLVPAFVATLVSHDPGYRQMWNVNAFPMLLGGRWLIPSTMALLQVVARGPARTSWGALLLIALAAISSMEILVFTISSWGYCLLLDAIRERSPRLLLLSALRGSLAIAAAHVGLALVIYLSTGRIIDYAPYFNILRDYRPVEGNGWSLTFDPRMALWLPIALSYFGILAVASWRAFGGEIRASLAEKLTPIAVFGLGPLAYFFGRPQEPALTLSCLPFAVVSIAISQVVFRDPGRFGAAGRALYAVMFFAFSFVVADSFEHFARPYDPTQGNSSILRRCFAPQGCLDAPRNIEIALTSQALDPRTSVGQGLLVPSEFDTRQRIEELMAMLRRLAPDTQDVGMVTDFWDEFGGNAHAISVSAAMATGHWRAWFYTAPFHDGQATLIAERVLKRVAATPEGTLIIISNRREGLVSLNQRILQTLDAHCRLSPVEVDRYHSAYKVIFCDGAKEKSATGG